MPFVGNLILFPTGKNLENWLRFDRVTAMGLVVHFLKHSVLCLHNMALHLLV